MSSKRKRNILDPDIGRKLFVIVMYITFIAATIISAIINILMFTQLSNDFFDKLLFLAISITLEGTKIFTVIKASMLRSIGTKIDQARLDTEGIKKNIFGKVIPNKALKASKISFNFYLLFAFIAIFASLGLSLTITRKAISTESNNQNKSELIINTAKEENTKYNKEIIELEYDKNKKEYEEDFILYEGLSSQLSILNIQYRESNWKDSDVYNKIVKVKAELALLNFEEKKKLYDLMVLRRKELLSLIDLNDKLISTTKLESLNVSTEQIEKEGTANMFSLLADVFKIINADILRFIMLMLISILIEVTIYTATPDISMSRKLLYYFRNHLPEGLDVDKLLLEFDNDLSRFKGTKKEDKLKITEAKEEEPLTVIPIEPEKVKEPTKENIEIKDTPKVDNILPVSSIIDGVTEIKEEVIVRKPRTPTNMEIFIKSLFSNGSKNYLKDKNIAAEESGIDKIEMGKYFSWLTTKKGSTGHPLIGFMKETGTWYPNYTSECIISLAKEEKI